jgi:hypothetical protein
MIVDIHTHVFDHKKDLGPRLLADMKNTGVDHESWGDIKQMHLSWEQFPGS